MKVFSKKQLYLFSLLSGVLLSLGWPAHGFPFLLLIAFVPLLIVEEQLYKERDKYTAFSFFRFAYISMVVWNALTTWWVCNATIVGGLAAIICNALFMALVLVLFHFIRLKTSNKAGYASLLIFWIVFEYLHLNWELSWPWLTLGNGFANYATCVQWYEFTGVLGGTFWILLSNILILYILKYTWLTPWNGSGKWLKQIIGMAAIVIFLPLIISLGMYSLYEEKKAPIHIVVVQPNIDPYNEKFSVDYKIQVKKMLELASPQVDSATDYLVFPETALTENLDESRFKESFSIGELKNYLEQHPHLSIVTGAETYKVYQPGEMVPESAHKIEGSQQYFDDYNTAIELNYSGPLQVYHKCKLVPGVEIMPFQKLLAPLAKLAFDLGGTAGTLGTQKEPSIFYAPTSKTTVGTAICYESIYGEYIGEYVRKGAQLILIITNDGWWKDTPGYRQHLCYARLRAVEVRRCIARSANTGISAFIDERGEIMQKTSWWVPATLKATLDINNDLTFYAEHGDYIGRYSIVLACLMIIFLTYNIIRKRK